MADIPLFGSAVLMWLPKGEDPTVPGFDYSAATQPPTPRRGRIRQAFAACHPTGPRSVPVSYTHLDVYKRQRIFSGLIPGLLTRLLVDPGVAVGTRLAAG